MVSPTIRMISVVLLHTLSNTKVVRAAAPPLFDYETKQLTNATLVSIPAPYRSLFAFGDSSSAVNKTSGFCKVFPGDATWPNNATWKALDDVLDGALIPTVPVAAPCYKNWGVYDKDKCAEIAINTTNPYFLESHPTANFFPLFQGKTCLAVDSPNGTCTLGGYPAYAVNISTVADIQLALNFARNSNLRFVVKNTGHDYLGKSLGAGALSVWTHNLKRIDYIEDYASDGGYKGPVFKVGAGNVVRELYEAAEKYGVSVTGGICESVGWAGGYFAGGGHNPLSGYYGMSADNVEAIEVVTPDGQFVTASNTSYPDLFWALRGGGGGTYGVVTSVTVRVHPKMSFVTSTWSISTSTNVSSEVLWEGIRSFLKLFPTFADAHTYSYFFLNGTSGSALTMVPFFAPNHTIASFNALVKPWADHLAALGIPFKPNTTQYDSFLPAFNDNWAGWVGGGIGTADAIFGNRLIPRSRWDDESKFNATFEVLRKHVDDGKIFVGYHQSPQNRLNVNNAVSPAWRHALAFLVALSFTPNHSDLSSQAQVQAATRQENQTLTLLESVSPVSEFGGSYLNEAAVSEGDWQASFYGVDNYDRLSVVKQKYDPWDLFYATTAVRSEAWKAPSLEWGTPTQDGRLCRV